MTKSLLIGKLISHCIKNNEYLFSELGDKVFPLVGTNKATFPFVVYWKENIIPEYTKDWLTEDTLSFSIIITDTSYEKTIDIAQGIREVLEKPTIKTEWLTVRQCRLVGVNEDFVENAYVEQLTFECKVQNT